MSYLKASKALEKTQATDSENVKTVDTLRETDRQMPKTVPGRGALSSRVQAIAEKHLGRKITLRELRLMPYVDVVIKNERYLDSKKVNEEEVAIVLAWMEKKWVLSVIPQLKISKEFYNAIQEILWAGYVTYDSETLSS